MKSLMLALSMYSAIPMPYFDADEKDCDMAICFFPIVGIIIGIIEYVWINICIYLGFESTTASLVGCALPLIITGGIHADGFIDTSDALSSYAPREKKLEILKDPHVGAFGIIRFVIYIMLVLASYSIMMTNYSDGITAAFCFSFALARTFSAYAALSIPNARKEGMLYSLARPQMDKKLRYIIVLQMLILTLFMAAFDIYYAIAAILLMILYYHLYKQKSIKILGGITGDLEGHYLCVMELLLTILAACFGLILRI